MISRFLYDQWEQVVAGLGEADLVGEDLEEAGGELEGLEEEEAPGERLVTHW